MPLYEYNCPHCGRVLHNTNNVTNCRLCDSPVKRKYSFSIGKFFEEGYNPFVGEYVKSAQHYKDLVRKGSDEASENTGIEHDYQLVDFHDHETLGVDMGDVEAQFKHHQDNNIPWT